MQFFEMEWPITLQDFRLGRDAFDDMDQSAVQERSQLKVTISQPGHVRCQGASHLAHHSHTSAQSCNMTIIFIK